MHSVLVTCVDPLVIKLSISDSAVPELFFQFVLITCMLMIKFKLGKLTYDGI